MRSIKTLITRGMRLKKYNGGFNFFDPHKSFFSLLIVRFSLILFISVFVASLFFVLKTSEIAYHGGYEGLNKALVIFKVPLGVLAISIPVIGILAAFHRSEQTREQIRVSINQNNFVNYYKHIEEFDKYIKSYPATNIEFININALHSQFFPAARFGDYDLDKKVFFDIDKCFDNILKSLGNFNNEDRETQYNALYDIEINRGKIISLLQLKKEKLAVSNAKTIQIKEIKVALVGGGFRRYIRSCRNLADVFIYLASFQDKPPKFYSTVKFSDMDLSVIIDCDISSESGVIACFDINDGLSVA